MDGADPDRWSTVATDWARLWGGLAEPVWTSIVDASGVGSGARVLDVGCGAGDFLAYVDRLGMAAAGIDPAAGMVACARARVAGADVRRGGAEHLPWSDREFDLVTSINAVQFAEDTDQAVAELARVAVAGGHLALATWAEGDRNDLTGIEDAVAHAAGEEPLPDGDLRMPGGLERLLREAGGVRIVAAGLVPVTWHAPDDATLVHGILLGEDPATITARAPTILAAARRFRTPDGGYHLVNAFRYAVGRLPAASR